VFQLNASTMHVLGLHHVSHNEFMNVGLKTAQVAADYAVEPLLFDCLPIIMKNRAKL